ncbi:HAMP domain-containing protein [Candidatus Gracilibacteria bacterium]|nr:HAMP domain-containing protein [Candidatus Gracilibacteria bacterium]
MENITSEALSKLELVAELKEDQVVSIIGQNLERLSGVTSRTQLRKSIYDYNKTGAQKHVDRITNIIGDAKDSIPDFLEIAVFSPSGERIAFSSKVTEDFDSIDLETIAEGVTEAELHLLVDDQGLASLLLSGPLQFEEQNIGSLIIRTKTDSLDKISEVKGLTDTFDVLIAVRDENGDAVFVTDRRFGHDSDARPIIPKEETNIPITQALLKNEILLKSAVDYRGQEVMAVTRYIDSQDWGLVVKIDTSEPIGHLQQLQRLVLFIGLVSLTIVMFIATFVAKSISNPIQNLTKVSDDISRGKLDSVIDKNIANSKDEIGDLARAFDRTVASLKLAMVQTGEMKAEKSTEKAEPKKAEEAAPGIKFEAPAGPASVPPVEPPSDPQAPTES